MSMIHGDGERVSSWRVTPRPCVSLRQVSADKRLKKAALDNALQALADPTKAAKVDPVSQAFVQYWKQKAVDMEKNKDKVGRSVG